MRLHLWPALLGLCLSSPPEAFEVASVRPSGPNRGATIRMLPGGRFEATGMNVRNLISFAYGMFYEYVENAPSWTERELYDIIATSGDTDASYAAGEAKQRQLRRLQALLAERFQLRASRRTKEGNVFYLLPAEGGSHLVQPQPGKGCPAREEGPGEVINMMWFTTLLAQATGQRVIDRTGLAGNYCVWLHWTNPDGRPRTMGYRRGTEPKSEGPALQVALREQIGLQLKSGKGPIETIYVESISRPTSN